jgi:hypothetical protein
MAFIEPHFRSILTECVERQSRTKTQRVTASTMSAVLKKYIGLGIFSAAEPPKGLVRHGKETGVDYVKRGDESSGWLMNPSDKDEKEWKKDKATDKAVAKEFKATKAAEEQRKADKRKGPAADGEVEAAPAPASKKARKAAKA